MSCYSNIISVHVYSTALFHLLVCVYYCSTTVTVTLSNLGLVLKVNGRLINSGESFDPPLLTMLPPLSTYCLTHSVYVASNISWPIACGMCMMVVLEGLHFGGHACILVMVCNSPTLSFPKVKD